MKKQNLYRRKDTRKVTWVVLAGILTLFSWWIVGFLSDFSQRMAFFHPEDFSGSDPAVPFWKLVGVVSFLAVIGLFITMRKGHIITFMVVFAFLIVGSWLMDLSGRRSAQCTYEKCDEFFFKVDVPLPFLEEDGDIRFSADIWGYKPAGK